MKITKMADYALRILRVIGLSDTSIVTSIAISQQLELSRGHIIKILRKLSAGEIVNSHRGIEGGYSLKKDLKNLTMLDIIEVMEGEVVIYDAMDNSCYKEEMKHINSILKQELSRYTIFDLVQTNNKSI